jgi:hypothetical protein
MLTSDQAEVPMIAMWDDHEIANDAWSGGAQNHQEATEGDYATRRRIAEQVYREWMPVADLMPADAMWTSYQIGNLATIIRTESRLSGRDKPAELAEAFAARRRPTWPAAMADAMRVPLLAGIVRSEALRRILAQRQAAAHPLQPGQPGPPAVAPRAVAAHPTHSRPVVDLKRRAAVAVIRRWLAKLKPHDDPHDLPGCRRRVVAEPAGIGRVRCRSRLAQDASHGQEVPDYAASAVRLAEAPQGTHVYDRGGR